jgi:DNA-binding CsgD family transcriptional regulator
MPLTRREIEVLRYIAEGNLAAEVAKILHISSRTVEWHIRKILKKLRARTRAEAVAKAMKQRLIEGCD